MNSLCETEQGITRSPYLSPDYILEVKVQGHTLVQLHGGESIHVHAGVSKSVFSFCSNSCQMGIAFSRRHYDDK